MTTITRTTSSRNVDAYRTGGTVEHDGKMWTVAGSKVSTDDQGGYIYTLALREPTPGEQAIIAAAAATKEIDRIDSAINLLSGPEYAAELAKQGPRLKQLYDIRRERRDTGERLIRAERAAK